MKSCETCRHFRPFPASHDDPMGGRCTFPVPAWLLGRILQPSPGECRPRPAHVRTYDGGYCATFEASD